MRFTYETVGVLADKLLRYVGFPTVPLDVDYTVRVMPPRSCRVARGFGRQASISVGKRKDPVARCNPGVVCWATKTLRSDRVSLKASHRSGRPKTATGTSDPFLCRSFAFRNRRLLRGFARPTYAGRNVRRPGVRLMSERSCYRYRTAVLTGPWRRMPDKAMEDAVRSQQAAREGEDVSWNVSGAIEQSRCHPGAPCRGVYPPE